MKRGNGGEWDGGYVRRDGKGRATYYIFRKVHGRVYEVSTRCRTSGAAEKELRRFELDPAGYRPGTGDGDDLRLSAELVKAFLEWSRDEKRNTPHHVNDQLRALRWWASKLGRAPLQTVKTKELVRALDTAGTGHKEKIATLKTFFTWLIRERHALEASQNPTAGLRAPQARPEQWTTPKAVSREELQRVREQLEPHWRDALDVLAGTGWHASELSRFAEAGAVEAHPGRSGASVLLCPRTKSGEPLRTEVSDAVAGAGRRVRARKSVDYFRFREALLRASEAAGVSPALQPGHLRHSVATWAIEAGASPEAVAAFLNHKSTRTTLRFYATHATPAKVPTLL